MMFSTAYLLAAIVAQAGSAPPAAAPSGPVPVAPVPQLVAAWVYPRATAPHLLEQNIVPREQDIVRMRTADPAEAVESFYRSRAIAEGGAYSVVSAVNQRIVANRFTVVTIERDGTSTVITVVANEPELEPDPATPFPVKKGALRPPPS
jgi:hypothetical protein